ncbi:MAG: zf-HC2 domain-containing protein [Armatimonadota bacterium]
MTCDREMLLLISAYADREATPEEAERAAEHLASCTGCRKMVEQWQGHQQLFTWAYTREITDGCSADELIRQAGKEQPMTEQTAPRIVMQERTMKHISPRRWAWAAALAAGLLIALLAYQIITSTMFLNIGQDIVTAASPKETRVTLDVDLTIGPNSTVRRIDARTIRVEKGWVAATVRGNSGITVATPRMTVTDRGTKFHAGTGAKADYVTVEEGAVDAVVDGTMHQVRAGEALLARNSGALQPLMVTAENPEQPEGNSLLNIAQSTFMPRREEELDWYEGLRRLAARFPNIHLASGLNTGMTDCGNDTDFVTKIWDVTSFRKELRAALPQIARTLAGGQQAAKSWEVPVTVMQLIGITSPPGLADDVYLVCLVPRDEGISWRFTGSQGNELFFPVHFEVPQSEVRIDNNKVLQAVYSCSTVHPGNVRDHVEKFLLMHWPGDAKPLLEFRVQGPQQLGIWQKERTMLAETARQCTDISGLSLKFPHSDLYYLDPQRKAWVLLGWNDNAGEQLCRISDQKKQGHGGSVILGVMVTNQPLVRPATDAGTYLVRMVQPASEKTPHIELSSLDGKPVLAWGDSSCPLTTEAPEKHHQSSSGVSTDTPPEYGTVDLRCSVMAARDNGYPLQFQVIGRPDDKTTRPIKKGNSTSWRIPTKTWAEGWIRIKKP